MHEALLGDRRGALDCARGRMLGRAREARVIRESRRRDDRSVQLNGTEVRMSRILMRAGVALFLPFRCSKGQQSAASGAVLGGTTWLSGGFWAPDGAYSRFVSPFLLLMWVLVVSRVLLTRSAATRAGW